MLACFVCCLARCAIVHSYKLLKLVLDYKDSEMSALRETFLKMGSEGGFIVVGGYSRTAFLHR